MQLANATAPWQVVYIDLVRPLTPSSRGNKWILCMMDKFTKKRTATASTVARQFLSLIVIRHGIPFIVQSDRRRQFTSQVFAELSRLLEVKQNLSCSYCPESNGLVERWNRTMAGMLRQYVSKNQQDWCQYFNMVMMAYCTSLHSSTGYTPFELQHGQQARLPTHLLAPNVDRAYTSETEFVNALHNKLMRAYDAAREANWQFTLTQKKYHDRSTNPLSLKIGGIVYLLRPDPKLGLSPKLQPKFKGPYQLNAILEVNGLVGPAPPNRGRSMWVHLNHLRQKVPREIDEYPWNEEEFVAGDQEAAAKEANMTTQEDTSTTHSDPDESPKNEETSKIEEDDKREDQPRHNYNLRSRQPCSS